MRPSSRRRRSALALALLLAGCSSTLRYTPAEQPAGVVLSADYAIKADRLRVEIDTNGYRLEEAEILRPDGSTVRAETIEHPGAPGSGLGLGVGVGSARRSGSVGVGAGVGLGTFGGAPRAEGNPVAVFALDQIGPGPWSLRIKVVGIQPVVIVLDPARRS